MPTKILEPDSAETRSLESVSEAWRLHPQPTDALAAAVEALRKLAAAHPENTELQSGMKELGENTGM